MLVLLLLVVVLLPWYIQAPHFDESSSLQLAAKPSLTLKPSQLTKHLTRTVSTSQQLIEVKT